VANYVRVRVEKADLDWDLDYPMLANLVVDNHTAEFTGLLDADGNPIVRMPRPIGFGRDNEW
jgi:hypothetical protein